MGYRSPEEVDDRRWYYSRSGVEGFRVWTYPHIEAVESKAVMVAYTNDGEESSGWFIAEVPGECRRREFAPGVPVELPTGLQGSAAE